MSIAHPHEVAEALQYPASTVPAPRLATRAWVAASLLLSTLGATSVYAYALHAEHGEAVSALAASEGELHAERSRGKRLADELHVLTQASAAQRAQLTDLSRELQAAHAELGEAMQSLMELADERGELGAELADLKAQARVALPTKRRK